MSVMIAGGGTGGHIFPALATAQAFMRKDPANQIFFVGSKYGMEAEIFGKEKFPLALLPVMGVHGKGIVRSCVALLLFPMALLKALWLLFKQEPDLVIGVGGYASVPMALAAAGLRYPLVLEEQNAVPGWTNRFLACFARRIFVAFQQSVDWFPKARTQVTGLPLRAVYKSQPAQRKQDNKLHILITGASQGARGLNQLVLKAMPYLEDHKNTIEIMHQSGDHDLEDIKQEYKRLGVVAQVKPFLDDFPEWLQWADVVIARAGAGTVWEVATAGKAAVFVPYPYHKDRHQEHNAKFLVQAGAAFSVDQFKVTAQAFAKILEQLITNPDEVKKMGERAQQVARPNADEEIVEACYAIVGKK